MVRRGQPWLVALLLAALLTACQGGGGSPAPTAGEPAPAGGAQVASTGPAAATAGDPRGQIFIDKGCVRCHRVSKLGVEGQEIGPDLTFAAADVRSRFGTDLASFLASPTGTMQIVLSSQIRLSDEERESIVTILSGLAQAEAK